MKGLDKIIPISNHYIKDPITRALMSGKHRYNKSQETEYDIRIREENERNKIIY
jgi:hypothetical protein